MSNHLGTLTTLGYHPRTVSGPAGDRTVHVKQMLNPSIGRVSLTLFTPAAGTDIAGFESAISHIESQMTSSHPSPDFFQGKRSPIFSLASPFRVDPGNAPVQHVGIQAKGFLYRAPWENCPPQFPKVAETYHGIGSSPTMYEIHPDGRLSPKCPVSPPPGGAYLRFAIHEALAGRCASDLFPFVTPPLGWASLDDLVYSPKSDGPFPLGVVLHPVAGTNRFRTVELLNQIAVQFPRLDDRVAAVETFFWQLGFALKQLHASGIIHGAPQIENFSGRLIVSGGKISAGDFRIHDFDRMKFFESPQHNPQFITYALLDLEVITRFLYLMQAPPDVTDPSASEIQWAQTHRGCSPEEGYEMFQHARTINRNFHAATEGHVLPLICFVHGYLGVTHEVPGLSPEDIWRLPSFLKNEIQTACQQQRPLGDCLSTSRNSALNAMIRSWQF